LEVELIGAFTLFPFCQIRRTRIDGIQDTSIVFGSPNNIAAFAFDAGGQQDVVLIRFHKKM
jgi:hypothetical protein